MGAKCDVPVVSTSEDGMMSTREFAAVLNVHTNTVRHWRKIGLLLPASQTLGGHARYNEKSIAQYREMIADRQKAERLRVVKGKSK